MLRLLATSLVLAAAGGVLAAPVPSGAPKAPDVSAVVRTAITDGLIEDGVPLALASELGKREDFLGKCAICYTSRIALTDYGKRMEQPVAKAGTGLPEELVKRLKSDKAEVRQPALRELIGRYVDRAFAKSEWSTEQKTALQTELERMRKSGESLLAAGQKFCPSCDGACRLNLKP